MTVPFPLSTMSTIDWRTIMTALLLSGFCMAILPTHAGDQTQARKDLHQMGLEFTGQQFAKSAGAGDRVAVELFLDARMDVNTGDGAAIGLAAGRGQTEMVKLLLERGAQPTSAALGYARTRGHAEIEKILIAAGARD